MNTRTEMNNIDNCKIRKKNNRTKSWLFEKINKIDKTLAKLRMKEKRLKHKIVNEKGAITADTTEIKRIIRDY